MKKQKPNITIFRKIWMYTLKLILEKYNEYHDKKLFASFPNNQIKGFHFTPQKRNLITSPEGYNVDLGSFFQAYMEFKKEKKRKPTKEEYKLFRQEEKQGRYHFNNKIIGSLFYDTLILKKNIDTAQQSKVSIDLSKEFNAKFESIFDFFDCYNLENYFADIEGKLNNKKDLSNEEIEIKKLIPLQLELLANLKKDDIKKELIRYFWCYLSLEIGKGIKLGKLGIFNDDSVELEVKTEEGNLVNYQGILEESGNNITFSLSNKFIFDHLAERATFAFRLEQYPILKQVGIEVYWGKFLGFNRSNLPVSGRAALQALPTNIHYTVFEDIQLPSKSKVPFLIKYMLSNDRSIFHNSKPIKELANSSKNGIKRFEKLVGNYEIFFLQNEGIKKSKLKINDDLSVNGFKSKSFIGKIDKMEDEIISISLRHMNEYKNYWKIILDFKKNKEHLLGAYIGFFDGFEIEMGRIALVKNPIDYNQLEIKTFDYGSDSFVKFKEKYHLIEFFEGKKDKFLVPFTSSNSPDESFYLNQELDFISGLYEVYFVHYQAVNSPAYHDISVSHMKIFSNGKVTISSSEEKITFEGKAYLTFQTLTINLTSVGIHKIHLQKIYKIDSLEVDILYGVYSSCSRTNISPICGKEIIIKINEDNKIPLAPIPMYSQAFYDLDNRVKGMSSFLSGAINNFIKTNVQPNYNLGEVFFNSACYLAREHKDQFSKYENKIRLQLNIAFKEGFNNKEQLEKEISDEGALFKLKDQIKLNIKQINAS